MESQDMKKVDWFLRIVLWIFCLFLLFVIFSLGFMMNEKIGAKAVFHGNQLYAMMFFGGTSIWLLFVLGCSTVHRLGKSRGYFEWFIGALGMLALPVIYFLGSLLLFANLFIVGDLFGKYLSVDIFAKALLADICLLAFVLFCCFYVWRRLRIGENMMVVYYNRVLYPGDEYFLRPFTYYNATSVDMLQRFELRNKEISCFDINLKVSMRTSINLELEDAKAKGIKELDYNKFRDNLERWLMDRIVETALRITAGELMTNSSLFAEGKAQVDGFPINWDGQVDFFNPVMSGEKDYKYRSC
jgi:hypothetical protein